MANKYDDIMAQFEGVMRAPSATSSQLDDIEKRLGYVLPSDYRDFLRDYSGLKLDHVVFSYNTTGKVKNGGLSGFYGEKNLQQRKSVADTYALFLRNYDPLEDIYDWYPGLTLIREPSISETELGWPEELLPIAYDSQLNHVCLALFGLRPGAIFFWISNPIEGEQNLYLVAESFDEFMHLLRKE